MISVDRCDQFAFWMLVGEFALIHDDVLTCRQALFERRHAVGVCFSLAMDECLRPERLSFKVTLHNLSQVEFDEGILV